MNMNAGVAGYEHRALEGIGIKSTMRSWACEVRMWRAPLHWP